LKAHKQRSPSARAWRTSVYAGHLGAMLRLSIGQEDPADRIADFDQALT
jgi:O-acetylhomoserine/O-acetylserine sulfhydrylase-like pyridoxal-dependent enzyme